MDPTSITATDNEGDAVEQVPIESTSWVPGPLYGCLKKADERLGPDRVWTGNKADQQRFLADYATGVADLNQLEDHEFKSMLSDNHQELNDWFKRNDFSIELDPFKPREFGTGAIVRLSAEWTVQGRALKELQLEDGNNYPGVVMGEESWDAFTSKDHPTPIAGISAKNGTTWYLTRASKALDGLDLYDYVKKIEQSMVGTPSGTLLFPKVDFDQELEPEVAIGLQAMSEDGQRWEVAQCVQQIKVKMNELGGIAESAAGTGIMPTSLRFGNLNLTIDGPALLWISKPETTLPAFTVVLGYDSFKDPGKLTFGEAIRD